MTPRQIGSLIFFVSGRQWLTEPIRVCGVDAASGSFFVPVGDRTTSTLSLNRDVSSPLDILHQLNTAILNAQPAHAAQVTSFVPPIISMNPRLTCRYQTMSPSSERLLLQHSMSVLKQV